MGLRLRNDVNILKWAGLREIRFHDLRHSYASMAIAAGTDPKALQRAMGHGAWQHPDNPERVCAPLALLI